MSGNYTASLGDHLLTSTDQIQFQLFASWCAMGPTSEFSPHKASSYALWRLHCSSKLMQTVRDRRACQSSLTIHELKMLAMMPQPRAVALCKHTGTE